MKDWRSHLTQFDDADARRFRENGWWRDRLLFDYVEEHAASDPGRTAVVDARGTMTRDELLGEARRIAAGLVRLGVQPGDVVTGQLPNWTEAVALTVACTRIGAVLNTYSPIFRARDVSAMLRLASPKVVITPDTFRGFDHLSMMQDLVAQLPERPQLVVIAATAPEGVVTWRDLGSADPADLPERPAPDAVAQLAFTSGTTGEPKGILHTHNTLIASAASYVERFSVDDQDVLHMASTVGHQTGILFGVSGPIVAGATAVMQEVWDAEQFIELVDRHGITITNGAIPFLADTLRAGNFDKFDLHSLRVFSCIGAGLPAALAHQAQAKLHKAKLVGGWGMTETGLAVTNLLTDPIETVCAVDGQLVPGAELRILDEELTTELPVGEEGQIVVRGPQRHLGFLQTALAQTCFLPDNWYITGDRGYFRPDGQFVMTTRAKDIIVRGGENIPVAEVENLVIAHPAVLEAAVVAVPDERLGERACACVVLDEGASLSLEELREWLSKHVLT